jgi:LytS/YehU family sensor histidine kinase
MKLRFNEKVSINLRLPTIIPEITLPPFMFISLIENAFKHGVSYKDESYINIELSISKKYLSLNVENSKTEKNQISDFSGIGLENTRKRLELLYGENYTLDITDKTDLFSVKLSIPLTNGTTA